MLMPTDDPSKYQIGSLDAIVILCDVTRRRYHAALFEEHPLPSQGSQSTSEIELVRLKSKFHHTEGSDTLEGAKVHLSELRDKLIADDACISDEPLPWDGQPGIVWIVSNWRKDNQSLTDVLRLHVGHVTT